MSLNRRLEGWLRAGIINEDTSNRIRAFEESCESFVVRAELEKLDRFYIPEARARELEKSLQDAAARDAAQILVSIDRNGTPALVDLLVDGAPIGE